MRQALITLIVFAGISVARLHCQEPQSAANHGPANATPEIITSITLEKFLAIVKGMGFDCIPGIDENNKPDSSYFSFRAEGYEVLVQVPSPEYVYLANRFRANVTLERINEWNRTNYFSRASWENGGVGLDTTIVIHGGVTKEFIENGVKTFRDSVAKWARFVIDNDQKNTQPMPQSNKPAGQ